MSLGQVLMVLVLVAGVAYANRDRISRRRPSSGAGASAAAKARELRTPLVRLATLFGIETAAERLATRYERGAEGERLVDAMLGPLRAEGWRFLPDLRMPRGGANIDILAFSPLGGVYVLDPKNWSERHRLHKQGGRLFHGGLDVTSRMDSLANQARTVSRLLSVRVVPIAVMVGPLQSGMQIRLDTIRIVPAEDLYDVLRLLDRQYLPHGGQARLVDTATRLLPPYLERKTR
ncbi:nuclease-related domain-containing protein [Streptomyces sp. NPDC058891]|uniref:nuclease-related domain-containing protein n=1 Tax=Streptomyces sp. NPDC058891 TaxID=3346667 RepID=UPI00368B653A